VPTSTLGFAATAATETLAPLRVERRDPRPDDVVIDILFCGVCHTDLHFARNDWGITRYPVVPGHEIIGRVAKVGAEVTAFRADDIVGVGCLVDSCRGCSACARGLEQFCTSRVVTYNGLDRHDGSVTYGGYSQRIVVSDKFVLRIPPGLDLKGAAPLLCAGITSWSPLRHYKVGPGSKVGVVGLGGLGHMALKFAKALGAETALFTRSAGKAEDARRFGADEIIMSTDAAEMQRVAGKFDLIIDTAPSAHDLNPYLPTLTFDGALVLVGFLGAVEPPLRTPPLILARRSVSGSLIGGIPETQEMLDFCGEHGIVSEVETIDIGYINQAYDRMLASDVKYRFVIDLATLKA